VSLVLNHRRTNAKVLSSIKRKCSGVPQQWVIEIIIIGNKNY